MNDSSCIDNLSIAKLRILLKQVKLGEQHLRKIFNPMDFNQLINCVPNSKEEKTKVKASSVEKSGSFLLATNAVITSILGAWFGAGGFLGTGFGTKCSLTLVLSLSLVAGFLLGFSNYRSTKKQSKKFVIEQKVKNLERKLIKLIQDKKIQHSNEIVQFLNIEIVSITDKNDVNQMIKYESLPSFIILLEQCNLIFKKIKSSLVKQKIREVLKDKLINEFNRIEMENIKLIKEIRLYQHKYKLDKEPRVQFYEAKTNDEKHKLALTAKKIEKLLLQGRVVNEPRYELTPITWVMANIRNVLVGLIPTFLGGFGSMFIYLDGVPNALKTFGIHTVANLKGNMVFKTVAISIAALITLYLAISFIASTIKSYRRDKYFEEVSKEIHVLESQESQINFKLMVFKKIKTHLKQMDFINVLVSSYQEVNS